MGAPMTMNRPMPDNPSLIVERSADLMLEACCAGFSIYDCLSLGISPVALRCNEAWKPLFALVSEKFGYCWEWVSTSPELPGGIEIPYWYVRDGEAVLTKVEK
jgi:hypothetical protein